MRNSGGMLAIIPMRWGWASGKCGGEGNTPCNAASGGGETPLAALLTVPHLERAPGMLVVERLRIACEEGWG
jgi:hypothetical protein